MKYQPRCLNLNVPRASLSQRKWEVVSDACLHPAHLGLFPSPCSNTSTFKWQCSISSPVIISRWFLFKLSNSPAFLTVFKKALSLPFSTYGMPHCSCFLFVQALITPLATSAHIPSAGSGPMSRRKELSLANWSGISFPPIPMCPGAHTRWTLLCSTGFIRDWRQSQTCMEFIWKLLNTLMAAGLSETVWVPIFVALFYILLYAWLDSIYFCLGYHAVEPKSAFIGPGPICIPDWAPFLFWATPVLPFTLVSKLDFE